MDKDMNQTEPTTAPFPDLHHWNGHGRGELPVVAATHLRLRPFTLADISPLMNLATQSRIADSALELPHPLGARQVRRWIESHGHHWQHGRALHWAISHLADDRLAGQVSLHDIDTANGQARMSLWIGARLERRDLAIEAAQAALAFAFTSLDLHRVYSQQLAADPLYGRVLFRLGMKLVAGQRQLVSRWGHQEEMLLWDLRQPEWLAGLTDGPAPARD
jgi:[ribosomal protein S5]-alanine N-acetyltransferase